MLKSQSGSEHERDEIRLQGIGTHFKVFLVLMRIKVHEAGENCHSVLKVLLESRADARPAKAQAS